MFEYLVKNDLISHNETVFNLKINVLINNYLLHMKFINHLMRDMKLEESLLPY